MQTSKPVLAVRRDDAVSPAIRRTMAKKAACRIDRAMIAGREAYTAEVKKAFLARLYGGANNDTPEAKIAIIRVNHLDAENIPAGIWPAEKELAHLEAYMLGGGGLDAWRDL